MRIVRLEYKLKKSEFYTDINDKEKISTEKIDFDVMDLCQFKTACLAFIQSNTFPSLSLGQSRPTAGKA